MTEDFDQSLAAKLVEDIDLVTEQVRLAMNSTLKVQVTGNCPGGKDGKGCSCKHVRYAEVPDYKTKMLILDWWSNRAYGRPGQKDSDEDSERITFQRLVEMPKE